MCYECPNCKEMFQTSALLGAHLGYPECCISRFDQRIFGWSDDYPAGEFALSGTGFVPCKSCNCKDEHELVDEINNGRKCKLRFL